MIIVLKPNTTEKKYKPALKILLRTEVLTRILSAEQK